MKGGMSMARTTAGSGCQDPSPLVVQAQGDQPSKVDRGDPERQPQLVAKDAAVANPAVAIGDEPGDRALDHRAVSSIRALERLGLGVEPCADHEVVMGVNGHHPTPPRPGTSLAQRASLAPRSELRTPRPPNGTREADTTRVRQRHDV